MDATKDFRSQIPLFSLFKDLEKDPASLEELSKIMKYESFQLRDYIINEKENNSRMFFLLQGEVEINKMGEQGQVVVLGKTDASAHPYFGESILFGNYKRSANVVAHSQCACLSLLAKDFEAFMKSHPYIVASIYKTLGSLLFNRLTKANKDIFIASLAFKS